MKSSTPMPPPTESRTEFEAYMARSFPGLARYEDEVTVNMQWVCGIWMAAWRAALRSSESTKGVRS